MNTISKPGLKLKQRNIALNSEFIRKTNPSDHPSSKGSSAPNSVPFRALLNLIHFCFS